MKNLLTLLLTVMIVWPMAGYAHFIPTADKVKLTEALDRISNEFDVYFTFDRELTSQYVVNYEKANYRSAEEALRLVLKGTNLAYQIFDDHFVIIYRDDAAGLGSVKQMINHLQGFVQNKEASTSSASRMKNVAIPRLKAKDLKKTVLHALALNITGTVTDRLGEPLVGVNVLVKGTNKGTATDFDGKFFLQDVDEQAVLIVSYVGYQTQEVPVAGKSSIRILLLDDSQLLDEVVVVGYGTQRRMDITSAVSSVKSEDFTSGSVGDAAQLIKGKVAGLTVVNPTGDPSERSQILLRGTATLKTSTQPLILIDGVPGDLNTLAPEDIESIDVLKDGSAAAIYGTRGTNGVILITSKRGAGLIEPSISYSGYVSTEEFVREPKMLNAEQYRERIAAGASFEDLGSNTDWLGEITNKMPITQSHNIAVRGGSNTTNYMGSFTYRTTPGMLIDYFSNRINGRVDVNQSMFDNRVKVNVNYMTQSNKRSVDFDQVGNALADFSSNSVYNQALWRNPTAPIRNEAGAWHEETGKSYYANPLGLLNETYGGFSYATSRISGSLAWEVIDGLTLKMLLSRSNDGSEQTQGHTKQHLSTVRDGLQGYATKSFSKGRDDLLELTADYNTIIGNHNLNLLGGYSYQENESEYTSLRNWDFPAGNFFYPDNIGIGQRSGLGGPNLMSSSRYSSNLIGFFGRASYIFNQKYLITLSERYEGSSRFNGADKPWGLFPAVSVGWHLGEEHFLDNAVFIDALKLRAGYGVTGTAPSQLYLGVPLLGFEGSFLINGNWVPSLSPSSNPNPSLRWEEKHEVNVGVDFAIFNNFFTSSIDYYNRRTNGLLYDYTVPTPPNAYRTTTANVGIMENKGFEFLVNFTPVNRNKIHWNSNISFSTNKNKLISLANDLYETTNPWFNAGGTGSPVSTYTHRIEVGKEIGNFYGYKVLDITDEGKWIYENKNGESSATRVEDDKQILGNGLPKYYAAWNNTLTFGRFDFSATMRGAFGFQILDYQRMYSENPGLTTYNQLVSSNDKIFGKVPLSKTVPIEYNSYYVEDGDYWKIDNIRFGYTFDVSNVRYINQATVYFAAINSFMITGYKGMDPEVNSLGLTPGNDDRNKYPSTRSYSIGFNITLK